MALSRMSMRIYKFGTLYNCLNLFALLFSEKVNAAVDVIDPGA